jgi:hypothetical protein
MSFFSILMHCIAPMHGVPRDHITNVHPAKVGMQTPISKVSWQIMLRPIGMMSVSCTVLEMPLWRWLTMNKLVCSIGLSHLTNTQNNWLDWSYKNDTRPCVLNTKATSLEEADVRYVAIWCLWYSLGLLLKVQFMSLIIGCVFGTSMWDNGGGFVLHVRHLDLHLLFVYSFLWCQYFICLSLKRLAEV